MGVVGSATTWRRWRQRKKRIGSDTRKGGEERRGTEVLRREDDASARIRCGGAAFGVRRDVHASSSSSSWSGSSGSFRIQRMKRHAASRRIRCVQEGVAATEEGVYVETQGAVDATDGDKGGGDGVGDDEGGDDDDDDGGGGGEHEVEKPALTEKQVQIQQLREELNVAESRVARTRGQKEELESEAQLLGQKAVATKEVYKRAIQDEEDARAAMKKLMLSEKKLQLEMEELQAQAEEPPRGAQVVDVSGSQDSEEDTSEAIGDRKDDAASSTTTAAAVASSSIENEGDVEEQDEDQVDEDDDLLERIASAKTGLETMKKEKEEMVVKIRELADKILIAEAAALAAETTSGLCMGKAEAAVLDESEAVENFNAIKEKIALLSGTSVTDLADPLQESAELEEILDEAELEDEETFAKPATLFDRIAALSPTQQLFVAVGTASACALASLIGVQIVRSDAFTGAMAMLQSAVMGSGSWLSEQAQMIPEQIANFEEGMPKPESTEPGLAQTLWLLATSVVTVPLFSALPGGSPVLGFLAGGALIGPYTLGLIPNVHQVKHIAELGVVFLLFNIGLELSLERLKSLRKLVFGLGSSQVLVSLAALVAGLTLTGQLTGSPGTIVAAGLALSSTAVAIQVLQDRGEMGSRHGRAAFSVLLFQDLAVVAILMLVPLLGGGSSGGNMSWFEYTKKLSKALSVAVVKAIVACTTIVVMGRSLLRPVYRRIAALNNTPIFAATTLLVVLSTSVMTQQAGLSMALGAFLAGLLIAETEYHLQVEADIAPYKGLLLGLFFMTVGMEISPAVLASEWASIVIGIVGLISIKLGSVAVLGPMFGLSKMSAIRAGLLLAPGGEFAFVTFGEAVREGILSTATCSKLFIIVAISMALTPYLAWAGQIAASRLESKATKALQPPQGEFDGMKDHVIIAGFGRVGNIIAQVLSEKLIPYVAIDVRSERVAAGRDQDLPVFFGDAGSPAVLEKIGAESASCAIVTLDSPAANYRAVWALSRHYPHISTYCRAHDIEHGRSLERAGANVVVPETLEPSLQLAAAALRKKMPEEEVSRAISTYRKDHISELLGGEAGDEMESSPSSSRSGIDGTAAVP